MPPPPTPDRILDIRLWKHYLSTTSFADGNYTKACLCGRTYFTRCGDSWSHSMFRGCSVCRSPVDTSAYRTCTSHIALGRRSVRPSPHIHCAHAFSGDACTTHPGCKLQEQGRCSTRRELEILGEWKWETTMRESTHTEFIKIHEYFWPLLAV